MGKNRSDVTSAEILASNLQQAIERNIFAPGDKLPTQQQLEHQYSVSRMVVREAIKILEGKGLVYSKQGSGIYVTSNHAPINRAVEKLESEYPFSEIYSTFEAICDYALFDIVKKEELSEVETLLHLNSRLLESYSTVSIQQKFSYESNFGASMLRISGNSLASTLYLILVQALTSADYALVFDSKKFYQILQTDNRLLHALLERDAYRARLWRQERDVFAIAIYKDKGIWDKKYSL